MSKKKILLTLLLLSAFCASIFFYNVWSRNKAADKAIAWIESHEGYIEYVIPEWISKWPDSLQGTIKDIVGAKLKVKLYITDSGNGPFNLSPLSNLRNLEELTLYHPLILDLSALKNLKAITHLHLANTELKGLEPLSKMPKLEHLTLTNVPIEDLSPLRTVKSLKRLFLRQTKVKNLEPLKGLNKLERLNLTSTPVEDIQALANLTELQFLYLGSTRVKDINSLKSLSKLEILDLSYSMVKEKEIVNFQKRFPNLFIKK